MNERIRQLAQQARHWAHFEGLEQNPTSSPDSLFEAKFAELIVRECVDTAFHKGHPDLEFLLKHFGVEE